jgi:hypothetical protein
VLLGYVGCHTLASHSFRQQKQNNSDALLHVYACDRTDVCPPEPHNDEEGKEETKDERRDQSPSSHSSSAPSILFVGESVRDEWMGRGVDEGEEEENEGLPTAAFMGLDRLELPAAPGAGRRMELKGFRAQIVVISATTVRIRVVTTIGPWTCLFGGGVGVSGTLDDGTLDDVRDTTHTFMHTRTHTHRPQGAAAASRAPFLY